MTTMRASIDLNCDLGEGMDADAALLELVSSVNIACGFHAGDETTMRKTVAAAKQRAVAIGAHPGYRDRAGFGRRPQALSPAQMTALLAEQIDVLTGIAQAAGARLTHVRAHGALGNLTDAESDAAQILVDSLLRQTPPPALMTLSHSAAERAALAAGLPVIRQFFADRAYDDHGQLVSRSLPGSVLHDPDTIIARLLTSLDSGALLSIHGTRIPVSFDTVCVHGDTPGALALAEAIREALEANGIAIRPYTEALAA